MTCNILQGRCSNKIDKKCTCYFQCKNLPTEEDIENMSEQDYLDKL